MDPVLTTFTLPNGLNDLDLIRSWMIRECGLENERNLRIFGKDESYFNFKIVCYHSVPKERNVCYFKFFKELDSDWQAKIKEFEDAKSDQRTSENNYIVYQTNKTGLSDESLYQKCLSTYGITVLNLDMFQVYIQTGSVPYEIAV